MKISVVLPAYNEEDNLKKILPKIYDVLGPDTEIIVVDDASYDNTFSAAQGLGVKVIRNPYNMGNGASVKRGMRAAVNEIVILMDADGQHLPEEIPKLLKDLENYDMVVGARTVNSSQLWWRRLANSIYNSFASYVSGVKIEDLTSGFRAFKKSKAIKFLYLLPNTFSYPSTLTLSFLKASYPVSFIPVRVLPREKGKSKINLINDGFRFLVIILKITVFFSPLKVFLPISIFSFSLGVINYVYTFIRYRSFTNMSALLMTTSVIIFMLGLISEQIAHLRLERIEENGS